jgi:hypothetical protein
VPKALGRRWFLYATQAAGSPGFKLRPIGLRGQQGNFGEGVNRHSTKGRELVVSRKIEGIILRRHGITHCLSLELKFPWISNGELMWWMLFTGLERLVTRRSSKRCLWLILAAVLLPLAMPVPAQAFQVAGITARTAQAAKDVQGSNSEVLLDVVILVDESGSETSADVARERQTAATADQEWGCRES